MVKKDEVSKDFSKQVEVTRTFLNRRFDPIPDV
jgi:hypothetical protein